MDISTSTRIVVVVNPDRTDELEAFRTALDQVLPGADLDVIRPDRPEDLPAAAAEAATRADVVAAVGGDGTQRTVAAALADGDVPLLVVPGGTVNLLGQVLGITSPQDSVRALTTGRPTTMDLGRLHGAASSHADEDDGSDDATTFLLNASTGFDATVMHDVDDGDKQFGRLGYAWRGLQVLRRQTARAVEVDVDGTSVYRGRAMSVLVTNVGQRASADFTLAPDSSATDGLLDLLVQRCDTIPAMLRTFAALARDVRPREEDLVVRHGRKITITWAEPTWAQVDGDAIDRVTSVRMEVRPAALTVFATDDAVVLPDA